MRRSGRQEETDAHRLCRKEEGAKRMVAGRTGQEDHSDHNVILTEITPPRLRDNKFATLLADLRIV